MFKQSANGRFSTYLFLDAGYVFTLTGNEIDQIGEYEYKNGWAINPGISFKINLLPEAGLMLDLGWFHHTSRLKWLPPSDNKGRKRWNLGWQGFRFFSKKGRLDGKQVILREKGGILFKKDAKSKDLFISI